MEYNLAVILQANKLLPKHSFHIKAVHVMRMDRRVYKIQNIPARLHLNVLLLIRNECAGERKTIDNLRLKCAHIPIFTMTY